VSRVRLAVAVAVAAAVAVVALVAFGGGARADATAVSFKGEVHIFQSDIPTDQVLYSEIENTSLRDVELDVDDVVLYDADGKKMRSSIRYLAAFAHGIFPWSQKPDPLGEFERRRLGELKTVKPGQSVPITLSWRMKPGGARPARVDLGPVELELPDKPAVRP
jgi:hypothetical protein